MKKEKLDRLKLWSVWLADLLGPHVSDAVQDAALAAWERDEDLPVDGEAWLQSVQQKEAR